MARAALCKNETQILRFLRRRELIAAALVLTSTAVVEADGLSASPQNSRPAWSGPWIGVFGEGATMDPNGTWSLSAASLSSLPTVINGLDAAGSGAITANGGAFGLEGGWNIGFNSNFILGADADIGRYYLQGSRSANGTVPVFEVPYSLNQSVGADWEGSLRLRGGYIVDNLALLFAEAGPALASLHYSSSYWDGADETEYKSLQNIKLGVSVGAGVEFAVFDRFTVKAEYIYSHFPSITGAGTSVLADGSTAYVSHNSGAFDQSAIRVGLSYYLK